LSEFLFKYSGSKRHLLKHYRKPPRTCKRIVEPYLEGGAYALNHDLPALGLDTNPYVVKLWHWLQRATKDDLERVERVLNEARSKDPKVDIRALDLEEGAMLYLKINVCGLIVGQWSSWSTYPQHSLPLKHTPEALEAARRVKVLLGDASLYVPQEGDMLFVDPPYASTSGNYGNEASYQPEHTRELIERARAPTILTYGDGAPDIFPGLDWEAISIRRVPNMRRGGSVERTEFVTYINWPEEDTQMNVFDFFGET